MTFKGWCRTALKAICTKQWKGQVLVPSNNNKRTKCYYLQTTQQGMTAFKNASHLLMLSSGLDLRTQPVENNATYNQRQAIARDLS